MFWIGSPKYGLVCMCSIRSWSMRTKRPQFPLYTRHPAITRWGTLLTCIFQINLELVSTFVCSRSWPMLLTKAKRKFLPLQTWFHQLSLRTVVSHLIYSVPIRNWWINPKKVLTYLHLIHLLKKLTAIAWIAHLILIANKIIATFSRFNLHRFLTSCEYLMSYLSDLCLLFITEEHS